LVDHLAAVDPQQQQWFATVLRRSVLGITVLGIGLIAKVTCRDFD
jgi:hypothetical protein